MSTAAEPALYSSMNEFGLLAVEPSLTRSSLILIGPTLRTFSVAVSECFAPLVWLVHCACATRSPFSAAGPDVILKVALALAPGATGPAMVAVFVGPPAPSEVEGPETTEVHCALGTAMLN